MSKIGIDQLFEGYESLRNRWGVTDIQSLLDMGKPPLDVLATLWERKVTEEVSHSPYRVAADHPFLATLRYIRKLQGRAHHELVVPMLRGIGYLLGDESIRLFDGDDTWLNATFTAIGDLGEYLCLAPDTPERLVSRDYCGLMTVYEYSVLTLNGDLIKPWMRASTGHDKPAVEASLRRAHEQHQKKKHR